MSATLRQRCADIPGAGSRVQRYNKKCKCANFEGKKVRFVWNEEQEKYYFFVIDVVQILTDSADIKQYVKRMRARDPELKSTGVQFVPLLK